MFDSKLHEAMEIVLLEQKSRIATTSEIAKEIERRGLYQRKDGETARANQINARVRQYPKLFKFDGPGVVHLLSTSLTNT